MAQQTPAQREQVGQFCFEAHDGVFYGLGLRRWRIFPALLMCLLPGPSVDWSHNQGKTTQAALLVHEQVRQLQPGAVASWWQPGHPGWAIYPVDSEQFMSTGALESVSVPNEQIVAPQPQMGGDNLSILLTHSLFHIVHCPSMQSSHMTVDKGMRREVW